jgi:hypothetical protein
MVREQWSEDLVDILTKLVDAKDELESNYDGVRQAIKCLVAKVDMADCSKGARPSPRCLQARRTTPRTHEDPGVSSPEIPL